MRSLLSEVKEGKIAGIPIDGIILPVLFLLAMWAIIIIAAVRSYREDPHPFRHDEQPATIIWVNYIQ